MSLSIFDLITPTGEPESLKPAPKSQKHRHAPRLKMPEYIFVQQMTYRINTAKVYGEKEKTLDLTLGKVKVITSASGIAMKGPFKDNRPSGRIPVTYPHGMTNNEFLPGVPTQDDHTTPYDKDFKNINDYDFT